MLVCAARKGRYLRRNPCALPLAQMPPAKIEADDKADRIGAVISCHWAIDATDSRGAITIAAVESVTRMSPQEAVELLDLALALFARENRDDDQIFRLISTIREG